MCFRLLFVFRFFFLFLSFFFFFFFFACDIYLYTIFIIYCFSSFKCVLLCFLIIETVCVVNVLYKIRYSWMQTLNYGTIWCSFGISFKQKEHSALQFLFHHKCTHTSIDWCSICAQCRNSRKDFINISILNPLWGIHEELARWNRLKLKCTLNHSKMVKSIAIIYTAKCWTVYTCCQSLFAIYHCIWSHLKSFEHIIYWSQVERWPRKDCSHLWHLFKPYRTISLINIGLKCALAECAQVIENSIENLKFGRKLKIRSKIENYENV